MRALVRAAGLAAEVIDLVVPRSCAGCAAPGTSLCPTCHLAAFAAVARRDPRPRPRDLPPAWSAAAYDGLVRDLVLAHKERGERGLTAPLGAALAAAVLTATARIALVDASVDARADGDRTVVLVPVPTARRAVAERGDDTVRLLARAAAGRLRARGLSVAVVDALAVAGRRADSAGLGAVERAANLAGAFRARRRARPLVGRRRVLLVDDVITTGSTLAEATRSLRSAGVRVAAVATVAATQRHRAPEPAPTQRHRAPEPAPTQRHRAPGVPAARWRPGDEGSARPESPGEQG